MTPLLLILLFALAFAAMVFGAVKLSAAHERRGLTTAYNIAEGTRAGSFTAKAAAAITSRYLLVKPTTNKLEVAIAGASDFPIAQVDDEAAAAGDLVNANLLGLSDRTLLMVASEAIALDDEIYTAANGKVQDLPTAAGTYYKVGRPLSTASADGELIEVIPCYPVKVIIP